jgi:hypothetical protein
MPSSGIAALLASSRSHFSSTLTRGCHQLDAQLIVSGSSSRNAVYSGTRPEVLALHTLAYGVVGTHEALTMSSTSVASETMTVCTIAYAYGQAGQVQCVRLFPPFAEPLCSLRWPLRLAEINRPIALIDDKQKYPPGAFYRHLPCTHLATSKKATEKMESTLSSGAIEPRRRRYGKETHTVICRWVHFVAF